MGGHTRTKYPDIGTLHEAVSVEARVQVAFSEQLQGGGGREGGRPGQPESWARKALEA